jgi:leucyl/phenylalanyl-tRNA--protein transferase
MAIAVLHSSPSFPPANQAQEDGLIAIGGKLTPEWLIAAYERGIFPWFSSGDPLLWWCPDPRLVLFPEELKVSKSLERVIKKEEFNVVFDQCFSEVIAQCALVPRPGQDGTWITSEIISAYTKLFNRGIAHSVAVYNSSGELVGGLYGVNLGSVFFGESMFALESNASKVGFVTLVRWLQRKGCSFIDCQITTNHLVSLGAREITRNEFLDRLDAGLQVRAIASPWCVD